jgi:hypothetical protein
VQVPSKVVEPIAALPVFADRKLCQLNAEHSSKAFQSEKTIKEHWRAAHNWPAAGKKGRHSRVAEKRIQERSQQGYRVVPCQRLFIQGTGSQYFEVSVEDDTVPANDKTA